MKGSEWDIGDLEGLKKVIRDVPDFPRKGIIFKDITTLLADGKHYRKAVDSVASQYQGKGIEKVVAIEARGFILGSSVAYKLGVGLVPVRKKGKLPYDCVEESYTLEYGTDTLEMHQDAIQKGEKVLLVDDLLATGGTAEAVLKLIQRLGGETVGCAFLIELSFLNGRKKINGCPVTSILQYVD